METCIQHQEMVIQTTRLNSSIEGLQRSFDEIKDRMVRHIEEGERPGGIREQVHDLMGKVSRLERRHWLDCLVAGVIGGLVSNSAPEFFGLLAKMLFR